MPYWLLPLLTGDDDARKQRLRSVFRAAVANDPVFSRAVDADDTRHALDEVAEYDAFRDGFLVLPTLQSMCVLVFFSGGRGGGFVSSRGSCSDSRIQTGYASWGGERRWPAPASRSANAIGSCSAFIAAHDGFRLALARLFRARYPLDHRLTYHVRLEPQAIPILRTPDPSLFRPPDPNCVTTASGTTHER
jgi:hypothetical protein